MTDERKLFLEHVQELKRRLVYCLIFLGLGSLIGYVYYPQILQLLLRPLQQPLYYSSPAGGFDLAFKIILLTGFLVTIPVFIYHTVQFLAPILPTNTTRTVLWHVLASSILMTLGVLFAYFIGLPAAITFFNSFNSDQLRSLISSGDYFSFLARYLVGFGLLFQIPLLILIINTIHPLSARQLAHYGRYVILASFAVAALITPTPDIINQTVMAVPIILLYYSSVALVAVVNK